MDASTAQAPPSLFSDDSAQTFSGNGLREMDLEVVLEASFVRHESRRLRERPFAGHARCYRSRAGSPRQKKRPDHF
jgi:hypothetical protein